MAGGTSELPHHTRLLQKLDRDVSPDWLSHRIFKVPNYLRQINEQAYEPQAISIGPYHHGKPPLEISTGPYHHGKAPLEKMEEYKMFYLKKLLERRTESSLERYVTALKGEEEKARKFYSEPLNHISGENFVEMMLLDGCFIIELIRGNTKELTGFLLRTVTCDLLLVENQLPFFIISKLFDMTNDGEENLIDIAIKFFSSSGITSASLGRPQNQDIKHLLGLFHDSCYGAAPSDGRISCPEVRISCSPEKVISSLFSKTMAILCLSSPSKSGEKDQEGQFMRTATELSEAGINFRKIEGNLFDIKFQKEIMSIPTLRIEHNTESVLGNLVAYEQCFKGASSKCFTDYIIFMDRLINTRKDVELLSHHEIIVNCLGDHAVVAAMFNKLSDNVFFSEDFCYAEIFKEVNKHCKRKWNLLKANLWHNYFNTPWAGISFFAALSMLLLTLIQTVCSVLSYHKVHCGGRCILSKVKVMLNASLHGYVRHSRVCNK